MLSKYSVNIVRTLRNLRSRRVIPETASQNVPLSNDELKELHARNQYNNDKLSSKFIDVGTIDKSEIAQTVHVSDLNEEGTKKKKFTLKNLLLSYPLQDAITDENQYEYLAMAVTPLNKYSYKKQLRLKQRHCENVLKEIRKQLKLVSAPLSQTFDKLPCPLEDIIPSPELLSYRNKDKFSVHTGVDGNPKTVGHFIGTPTDPLMRCVPPTYLVNIRESHKMVQKHFQSFIRNSPYETCTNFKGGGVWRNLWVRSNLKGDLMAVVIIHPSDLSPEAIEEIKHDLKEYFFHGPGLECELSSLYLQSCEHTSCSREVAPFDLIAGEPYLIEECLGKKFRISPDSFFQINTKGAELLFDSVRQVSEISPLTTLLDVCCGTGIASIILAPHCRGAIGIDSVSGSIEDAIVNAKENDVRNVNFIHGKAEKVLPLMLKELEDCSDIAAVVNPARSGLHSSVVRTIRQCKSINKVIYVTCKPEGNVVKNLSILGTTIRSQFRQNPKQTTNIHIGKDDLTAPFALRYAIPVDLFPHTAHVEFVFLLERLHNY